MSRFDDLSHKVEVLYAEKQATRSPWADWMYPNHVGVVAAHAKAVAERVGADVELSQVAALLHDIADIKMDRANPAHEAESLNIARQIMLDCGYSEEETTQIVDDAIRFHSCHGDERPKCKEGLVLATADSMAHLQTDFYVFATWEIGKRETLNQLKSWVLNKLERDLNNKIAFDDIRKEVRPDYELIKNLYSR
jgi:putative nucleotidyltransferase with HDIG domain